MFKNKVVLITGGTRGIGNATAIKFASLGAKVVAVFKSNNSSAKKLEKEISVKGGFVDCIQADVSNYENLKELVSKVIAKYKQIDILVNNAGIVYDREFEEIKYDEALNIVKTNMLAPLFLCQLVAPIMMKQGKGKIVNVSSTSGMYDFNPGTADYAMSKLAL